MNGYYFTAIPCAVGDDPGYMVTQHRTDGSVASENYVDAEGFKVFCQAVGGVQIIED